jgi:recombination protein RecA
MTKKRRDTAQAEVLGDLKDLYADLDKHIGKGEGRLFTDQGREAVPRLSTGTIAGDWVTGGGLPRGRIVEFYGTESGGKTSFAIRCMVEAQRAGGLVGFADAEHAFDPEWAARMGLDLDKLLFLAPDNGEQALTFVERLVDSGKVTLVVVDSVAALVPKAELEGQMTDAAVGVQARMMGKAMRRLAGRCEARGATVIFINQLREKVGVMFGNPEVTPGGKALKFYASIRLEIRKGEPIKQGDERTGDQLKLKAVKNKTAPPFRKAELPLSYTRGIHPVEELLALALEHELIERRGGSYVFRNATLGVGREATLQTLLTHPETAGQVRVDLLTRLSEDDHVEQSPALD